MFQDCAVSAALYTHQVLINDRLIKVLPKLSVLEKIETFLSVYQPQKALDSLLARCWLLMNINHQRPDCVPP